MKNCGACYYRDSTWSSQHREMSARCDHDNAPEESLLELRVGADSVVGAPCWCPLETEDTKVTDEINCPLCVDLSRRVTELEIRLTSMKMIGQPHEPAERTEYVVALERVYTAASDWLDHLEKKSARHNDGVPGELMDAVDNIEQILLNPKRQ